MGEQEAHQTIYFGKRVEGAESVEGARTYLLFIVSLQKVIWQVLCRRSPCECRFISQPILGLRGCARFKTYVIYRLRPFDDDSVCSQRRCCFSAEIELCADYECKQQPLSILANRLPLSIDPSGGHYWVQGSCVPAAVCPRDAHQCRCFYFLFYSAAYFEPRNFFLFFFTQESLAAAKHLFVASQLILTIYFI